MAGDMVRMSYQVLVSMPRKDAVELITTAVAAVMGSD
jgi:hypothetical protein